MKIPVWIEGDPSDLIRFPVPYTPEKKLLSATIARAMFDLESEDREARENAKEWLFSNDESAFSLIWVLGYLEINVTYFRQAIQKYLARKDKRGKKMTAFFDRNYTKQKRA